LYGLSEACNVIPVKAGRLSDSPGRGSRGANFSETLTC